MVSATCPKLNLVVLLQRYGTGYVRSQSSQTIRNKNVYKFASSKIEVSFCVQVL